MPGKDAKQRREGRANDAHDDDARPPPPSSPPLAIAGWGLVIFAGMRALELVLEAQSMAVAVGQALLAEWGGARLGVTWTAREGDGSAAAIARRAGVGAAVGLAVTATLVGLLYVTRSVFFDKVEGVPIALLVVGLLSAGLRAMRDELLFHGVLLRALAGVEPAWPKVVACGITSAGAALAIVGVRPEAVVVRALLGMVFGALWLRDRGAWQAVVAHGSLLFATGTLLSGGVAQAQLLASPWAGASAGILGGSAAVVAVLPFAVGALAWAVRSAPRSERMSPGSRTVG